MLHFACALALAASGADPNGSESLSVRETAARILASSDDSGAAEQADPPLQDGFTISHADGSTTLTLANAEIVLTNRLQFRFENEMPPASVRLPGTTAGGQSKPSFRIRRAKTSLEGWFWKKELTYELQLSWAGPEAGASTQTPLEDATLTWDASKKGTFEITIGQLKVPLGRQEMTSSGRLQFADRSLLNGEFTRGRDIGIQFSGRLADQKLQYYAGVFNGNAASRSSNDNTKLQYNARVSFEPLGPVPYAEPAFDNWDKAAFALGGQFENNDLSGATNLTDLNTTILGADLVYRYKGFSFFAEYYHRKRTPEAVSGTSSATSGDATGSSGSFNSNGYQVQAGYFLKRDRVEIAGRFATYDPSDRIASNDRKETGAALNFYINRHSLKVISDFRALRDDLLKRTTKELRIQTQFMF